MREIKKAICLLVCMMCLMPVMLAGCAGQQGAQSGDGQQQASEEQAADISYADARISYLGPNSETSEDLYYNGILPRTNAENYESYIYRMDFKADPNVTCFDRNGKEHTMEKVEEYLENKKNQ